MILFKTKTIKLLTLLTICFGLNVQAQQAGSTLSQQYEEVVVKAGSYRGHKEIREDKLQTLWRNTMDSLQKERQLVKENQAKLRTNEEVVAGLRSNLSNKQQTLIEAKANVDEVSLLGISLNKSTYNSIMWGLVFLLMAGLAFTIWKTKASVKEASSRSDLYNELFEELRDYKTKANEKEKKLARELQTERNRLSELTGR